MTMPDHPDHPPFDISKASRETLERLAMRAHEYATVKHYEGSGDMDRELDKLRAECSPKLRTRAEVDAEIATMVRIAYGAGSVELTSGAVRMTSQIEHLCAEPVRDDDPPQPDRMTEAVSVLHKALQRAENLAQGWRDRAFDSAHMSKLKSDTLEECAAELDAVIATAAPDERRAKTKGEKDLAEPLPSAIKGPPMTRDEYLASAMRLSPDPRTEPDPRPKCIRCAMRWTPPDGADATVTPCFDCCYVDPATELDRLRAALGEIRGSVDRVERTPIDRVIEIKSILTKVGA